MSNEYQKFLLGSVFDWRIAKEQLFKLLKTSVADKVRLAIVWYKKSYQKYNDIAWNQKEEFGPFLDKRRTPQLDKIWDGGKQYDFEIVV